MIPAARPDLSGNESAYVGDAIASGWVSSRGAYVDLFQREFAEFCGTRRALAVSSGTTALHVVLAALGVGGGDEVIVPSLTFIATANAVRYQGATPVLVDADPETWTIDPRQIESAIGPNTRGIIAVHLYGHPADMDEINEIAKRHSLWVVEDAAEAHGARYKGRPAGSLADAAIFSFFGNKIITCGEGGAVTTDSDELADRVNLLKAHGMDPSRRYFHPVVGFNYRLTNVACAMLCAQLERFAWMRSERNTIYETYREALAGVEGLTLQPEAPWAEIAPWAFPILIDKDSFGTDRDGVANRLSEEQIETRPFFVPVHMLPPYESDVFVGDSNASVTERLSRAGLLLPTYVGMSEPEVLRVAEAIRGSQ